MSTHERELGFLMASILTGYPDEGYPAALKALLEDERVDVQCMTESSELWPEIRREINELIKSSAALDELRSSYIDSFDRGKAASPLYETEYGRSRALGKTRELADISGFYRAFGLEIGSDPGAKEMVDHVSVELEFYALLLLKEKRLREANDSQGVKIVLDARSKFLRDHLGRFVHAIRERPGVSSNPTFSRLYRWCDELVGEECARLGVYPERVEWVGDQGDSSEVACGASEMTGTGRPGCSD